MHALIRVSLQTCYYIITVPKNCIIVFINRSHTTLSYYHALTIDYNSKKLVTVFVMAQNCLMQKLT